MYRTSSPYSRVYVCVCVPACVYFSVHAPACVCLKNEMVDIAFVYLCDCVGKDDQMVMYDYVSGNYFNILRG